MQSFFHFLACVHITWAFRPLSFQSKSLSRLHFTRADLTPRSSAMASAGSPLSSSGALCATMATSDEGGSGKELAEFSGVSLLGAKAAQELDEDLMSSEGGYLLAQLMELAGLSCSEAVAAAFPVAIHRRVLVVCGPGNNGGDGLVCARHLFHQGYSVTVVYPKQGKNPLFQSLVRQFQGLGISVHSSLEGAGGLDAFDCAVDAVFGFSFEGTIRPPFDVILAEIATASRNGKLPVLSVDVPSGWHVDRGDLSGEDNCGLHPQALVSLTAPKPCAVHFKAGRHFLGGRFVPPAVLEKYALKLPAYSGTAQVVELLNWGKE